MANRRPPEFLELPSQPGLRIAFSLMAYYKLYVPPSVMRAVEILLTFQSLLLLFFWVFLHFAFLTHPTLCINQSDTRPNISQLSGTDVLRLSIWFNYTIPLVTYGQLSLDSKNPNYKTLLKSYSSLPVSLISENKQQQQQQQLSYSLYHMLVSQDTFLFPGDIDEDTDLMYQTEIVKLNQSHIQMTTLLESFEFCPYEGVLKLPPDIRTQLGINTSRVDIDYFTAECLQVSLGFFPVATLVGFNEILMQSFRYLSKNHFNSSGYVQDLRSREMFRFYSTYFDRTLLIFAIFPILILALISSNLLWFCHVVLHHLAPMFMSIASLTLMYALFGILAVMTGLLNDDGPLCLIVMLAVFSADQYYLVFCNHPVSKRQWPKFFYLFLFVFVAYYLRFDSQLFLYALVTCYMLLTLSIVYFMHRWELPLVDKAMRQGGLNVNNINSHTFRAAYQKYQHLLTLMHRPHQLIQVDIQVGAVMPPPPPPPVPHFYAPTYQ